MRCADAPIYAGVYVIAAPRPIAGFSGKNEGATDRTRKRLGQTLMTVAAPTQPCRNDPERGALVVTGPQPGMIGIGGYRLPRNELDATSAALPTDSPIAALPDSLLGQRLRGRANDPVAARLAARAANPLIAGAFQTR